MLHAREVLIHRVEAPPSHSHLRHGCSEVAAKPTVGNAQVAQHFHAARLQLSTARTAAAQGDPRSAWQHAAAAASWLAAAQQLLGSNVQNNELDHLTEQVSALMSPGAAR
jgi:hypothetical protein